MADGLDVQIPDDVQASEGEAGERVCVSAAEAQSSIAGASGDADVITWDQVTAARDEIQTWYSPYRNYLFANAGIDGFGIEVSVEAEAGFGPVGVGVEPIGISILWITNSEVDASSPDAQVDPMANPHYFMFNSRSVSTGVDLGGSGSINVEYFFAHRFGPAPITRGSWAGPVLSFDAEVGGSLVVGAEFSASAFSSVDYDRSGPNGVLNFGRPESGWKGASYSMGVETGVQLEATLGISAVDAFEQAANYLGRPDVRKVFEEGAPEVPEEGEFHYQRDVAGGGFFSWLAGSTSGVGDALKE